MSKRRYFILNLIFFIMIAFIQVFALKGLCLENEPSGILRVLEKADNLLADKSYVENPNKAEKMKLGLEDILKKIKKDKSLLGSAEGREIRQDYINKLEKRKNAFNLVIGGKQLPSRNEIEQQKLRDCICLLDDYVKDTTRTVFVDKPSVKDLSIQKIFLNQLASCLETFARDENSLREASPLLIKLFIYKRIDFAKCIEALINLGNFEAAGRLFTEIAKAGHNAGRITELVQSILTTQNYLDVIKLYEKILSELSHDTKTGVWLETEVLQGYFNLMKSFKDHQLLTKIFQQLIEIVPSDPNSDEWKMAKIIQRIQDEILQRVDDKFESANRIKLLAKQAYILSQKKQSRQLHLSMLTTWRTGDFQEAIDSRYIRAIEKGLREAFQSQNFLTSTNHFTTYSEVSESLKDVIQGDHIAISKFTDFQNGNNNEVEKPDIFMAGTYTFQGRDKPVTLQLTLFDAETGIVLDMFTKEIQFNRKIKVFQDNVKAVAERIAIEFQDVITSYLKFEIFVKTFPADETDLKKFQLYLFYGNFFDIEWSDRYDELSGLVVDHIYIEEDFFYTYSDGKRFSPFLSALKEKMVEAYSSQMVLPVKARQIPTKEEKKDFLHIRSYKDQDKGRKDTDWSMHVLIRRNYVDLLKIRPKFRPNSSNTDEISQDQAEFAAVFITLIVKSFLGSNQEYFLEKVKGIKCPEPQKCPGPEKCPEPKSKYLSSFFMPGQLRLETYAREDRKPPWHLKAWNLSNISLLGLSLATEALYISSDYENDDLFWTGVSGTILFLCNGLIGIIDARIYDKNKNKSQPKPTNLYSMKIQKKYDKSMLLFMLNF